MSTSKKTFAPVPLKTMLDHIVKANPTSTLTTKKMRVKLREQVKGHDKNQTWIFNTPAQYDAARALFDPAYAKKVAKPARAPRAKKVKEQAPVEA